MAARLKHISEVPRTDRKGRGTGKLPEEQIRDQAALQPPVHYRPIPSPRITAASKTHPVWRVRFEMASDPGICFGLDINGEVILGRGQQADNCVDLTPYGALEHGVSRHHVTFRPSATRLYVIDPGSTNGTQCNGQSIGFNTPHLLKDLDTLTLGGLSLVVRIIQRPRTQTGILRQQADIADSLIEIADAITSHLDLDEVLNQITETAREMTSAGEVGIWLVDDQTGELYLEAQRGIEDEQSTRWRVPVAGDSLVSEVIKTGHPIRASRGSQSQSIKVKTGYLVESLIYMPLSVAEVTFGVLMVAHREVGKEFTEQDERLLATIAHFAATAVQNARLYGIADKALQKRARELAALNELGNAVSSSLDLARVHAVLQDQISKHWKIDQACLWLVDERTREAHLYAPTGQNGNQRQTAPDASLLALIKRVIDEGKPALGNRLGFQLGEDSNDDTLIAKGNAVAVPLQVQEQVVGVLTLYRRRGDKFTEEDMVRLCSFANPVAAAVQNARLFAGSERERATIRAMARTFPHPVLIVDEQGDIYISNAAAEHLLNAHMNEVFDAIRISLGRTSRVMVGGRAYVATTEYEEGLGTIALMQDVSEYKRAEEALRLSEERYRTLIETSPDAITVTNLEGVVTVCNWQTAILHGLSGPEEAIGKTATNFVAPEDRQRARDNMAKVLKQGSIRNLEYTLLRKDGTRFPVEMNASLLLDADKHPTGFIGVVRDITHVKQLEKTRTEFIRALSHDLKGPLTSIRGWGELLKMIDPTDERHSRYIGRIIAGCDALFDMIRQLLDIASLSQPSYKLNTRPCRPNEIVARASSDLEGAALIKSIQLEYRVDGEPYAIKADGSQLYRTVLNLIENAIKYSPDKAKVTVSVIFDQDVTIRVRDTGPGIPEEDLPYVFDPYYRGRQAESGKAGIGLGLATARAMITAHGGTITVQNVQGGGAEFVISLPSKLRIADEPVDAQED